MNIELLDKVIEYIEAVPELDEEKTVEDDDGDESYDLSDAPLQFYMNDWIIHQREEGYCGTAMCIGGSALVLDRVLKGEDFEDVAKDEYTKSKSRTLASMEYRAANALGISRDVAVNLFYSDIWTFDHASSKDGALYLLNILKNEGEHAFHQVFTYS